NAQGYRLTGYEEGGTNIVPVRVPTGNIAPLATTTMWATMNLDANATLAGGQVLEKEGVVVLGGTSYTYTGSWAAPTWTGAVPNGTFTTGTAGVSVTFAAGVPDAANPAAI